jgi:hypothetical protein
METTTRDVKKFKLSMMLNEKSLATARPKMELFHISGMRDKGYAPCLDIDSTWESVYLPMKDEFEVTLSMYFVFVGKKRAWNVQGVSSGKIIPMSTPSAKSE